MKKFRNLGIIMVLFFILSMGLALPAAAADAAIKDDVLILNNCALTNYFYSPSIKNGSYTSVASTTKTLKQQKANSSKNNLITTYENIAINIPTVYNPTMTPDGKTSTDYGETVTQDLKFIRLGSINSYPAGYCKYSSGGISSSKTNYVSIPLNGQTKYIYTGLNGQIYTTYNTNVNIQEYTLSDPIYLKPDNLDAVIAGYGSNTMPGFGFNLSDYKKVTFSNAVEYAYCYEETPVMISAELLDTTAKSVLNRVINNNGIPYYYTDDYWYKTFKYGNSWEYHTYTSNGTTYGSFNVGYTQFGYPNSSTYSNYYQIYAKATPYTKQQSVTNMKSDSIRYTSAKLLNCTTNQTLTSSVPVIVNGGNYQGQPAFSSSNITVKKGTITDDNGTNSTFLVDSDSESSVTTSGTKTITTVKLINPPIIIDWADFPGIDLNCYCCNLLAKCALV